MKSVFLLLFSVFFLFSCRQLPHSQGGSGTEGLISAQAMVVTAHPLASRVGIEILKKGGNAYDAAIAIQYALAVVLPRAGNIGGGGFMLARNAEGEKFALDFREKAPAAAHEKMYQNKSGEVIAGLSLKGHKAVGVPGTVAGMAEIYHRFGTLPFDSLIGPAIALAREGFLLTEHAAGLLNRFQDDFRTQNTRPIFLVRKTTYRAGEKIQFSDLAKTLERIRKKGTDGFYKGETARLIVAEMQRGGGLITAEDLKNYKALWRRPLQGTYRKIYRISAMPPPSSGGVALLQLLKGSENYNFKAAGHNSAAALHQITERARRVYADRSTHLGDADFYQVPLKKLLDSNYIAQRNADISPDTATPSLQIKHGRVEKIESFETTHFSVVDAQGNAVAITTTLNSYFGAKVLVGGAGFFLNNEMDDFSVKPGTPNQFGLVGSAANAIRPGKRMLSSMSPTIVEKNGELFMVLGTPGGSTIITNVYQVILNVIDHGFTMQEAVNAKKIHAQWLPDQIVYEQGGLTKKVQKKLKTMKHKLVEIEQIGRFEGILRRENGTLEGAADNTRSGDATASGY